MTSAISKRKYESPRQVARQTKILATAREMLEEGGYDGLTMRGLAREAGVAQGTLYNLYGSKDDLIIAALDDLMTNLAAETIRRSGHAGIDSILTSCTVTGRNIQRAPAYAEAMTRIIFSIQRDSPLVDLLFARAYPGIRHNLRAARDAGEMREGVDIDIIAKHLTGADWSVIILWMMGMLPLEDMIKERMRSVILVLLGVTCEPRTSQLRQALEDLDA